MYILLSLFIFYIIRIFFLHNAFIKQYANNSMFPLGRMVKNYENKLNNTLSNMR